MADQCEDSKSVQLRKGSVTKRKSMVTRRSSSLMFEYYRDNYMNSKEVTEKQFKDMHEAFELLDTDRDGKLTKRELETLFRFTGDLKSDREMEEMLSSIDPDQHGFINFKQFQEYVLQNKLLDKMPDETCYEMEAAFKVFDKNNDGFIDREELKAVLTTVGDKMTDELAEEFIKEADTNGDGKIDYSEFCTHMGY